MTKREKALQNQLAGILQALHEFHLMVASGELNNSSVKEVNDELMLAVYEYTGDSRSV